MLAKVRKFDGVRLGCLAVPRGRQCQIEFGDHRPENNQLAKSPVHDHVSSGCPKEFSMTAGQITTPFALKNPLGVLTRLCFVSLLAAPTALMLVAMSQIIQNQRLRDGL
ncbi:MAG TPA: hypothetical protein VLV85_01195 [Stellaceae bacterium]|nr:hypothetical protein [Stellaceae bacterium]